MNKIVKNWLPFAIILTIICGLMAVVAQNFLRMSANDQPLTMLNDVSAKLNRGETPDQIMPLQKVNLNSEQSPFLIILSESKQVIYSSANIDGNNPKFPGGVLDYSKNHPNHTVTWQPQAGLRFATASGFVSGKSNYYIVAGQSLKQTENKINKSMLLISVGWLLSLGSSLAIFYLAKFFRHDLFN